MLCLDSFQNPSLSLYLSIELQLNSYWNPGARRLYKANFKSTHLSPFHGQFLAANYQELGVRGVISVDVINTEVTFSSH